MHTCALFCFLGEGCVPDCCGDHEWHCASAKDASTSRCSSSLRPRRDGKALEKKALVKVEATARQ